jgi:hypothetical protein
MSKKVMIMLLTLLFTCLAFFGLGDVGLFHWEDCRFGPRSLVETFQGFL